MSKRICYILIIFLLGNSPVFAQSYTDTPWDTSTNVVGTVEDTLYETSASEEAYEDGEYDEEDTTSTKLFEHRRISEADWSKIKNDSAFIYKKHIVKEKSIQHSKPFLQGFVNFLSSGFFRFLMFAFVGLVVIAILYLLFKHGNINLTSFRQKKRTIIEQLPVEHVKEFTAWDSELQQALALPDYRKAIRIHYLSILHIMDEKKLIQFKDDKTNWEYVHELNGFSDVHYFIELTKYFDYIWYGEFALDAEKYQLLSTHFLNFKQKIE